MLALSGLLIVSMALAQQPSPPQQTANPGAAAHYDRMAAAKTVFLKNIGGNSDIPFNVISRDFESWGCYVLVDSPDDADMVIEIQARTTAARRKTRTPTRRSTAAVNRRKLLRPLLSWIRSPSQSTTRTNDRCG